MQNSQEDTPSLVKTGEMCRFYAMDQHMDTPIYRLMPIPAFFHLLKKKILFFRRLETFFKDDPCECTFFPPARYSGMSKDDLLVEARKLRHVFSSRVDVGNLADHIDKYYTEFRKAGRQSMIEALKNLERADFAKSVVCDCWHLGPDESDAMWRLYAGETGVAIESTPRLLDKAMKGFAMPSLCSGDFDPEMAPIRYDRLADEFYLERPWIFKTAPFSHEKELRIFLRGTFLEKGGVGVQVNVKRLIRRVIVSPENEWAHAALKDGIQKLLNAFGYEIDQGVTVSPIRTNAWVPDPIEERCSRNKLMDQMHSVLFDRAETIG